MGTTTDKLQGVLNSKAAIKSAIEEKGQTVGNIPLAQYADKIKAISTGGSGVEPRLGVAVADSQGNLMFQPLSFTGDVASDNGALEDFTGYSYNTGKDEPAISGGSCDYYKCTSVDVSTKTWAGNKAVLTDGIYTFEDKETTGLKYDAVTPSVGKIYSNDTLTEVAKLYEGIKEKILAWFEPKSSNNEIKDLSGNPNLNFVNSGGVVVDSEGNLEFSNTGKDSGLRCTYPELFNLSNLHITIDFKLAMDTSRGIFGFTDVNSTPQRAFSVNYIRGLMIFQVYDVPTTLRAWHKLELNYKKEDTSPWTAMLDGQAIDLSRATAKLPYDEFVVGYTSDGGFDFGLIKSFKMTTIEG